MQESITSHKLLAIANNVLNEGNSAIPPLFNGLEMWSTAPDKEKLFAKTFLGTLNLYDLRMSLPVFPSRTIPNYIKTS